MCQGSRRCGAIPVRRRAGRASRATPVRRSATGRRRRHARPDDPRGPWRDEERDDVGDLVDGAEPPQGSSRSTNAAIPSGSSCTRRSQLPPGKSVEPGATLKHADPVLREVARHRLREADLRRLRDVVARAAACLAPPDRRDAERSRRRHARAACGSARGRRASAAYRFLPSTSSRSCDVHLVDRPAPEPPTLFTTMSSPPNASTAPATTAAAPSGVVTSATTRVGPPGPSGRAHRLLERLRAARAEDDVRALLDEPRRDVAPDPPARAGDERDLACEPEIHGG